jgi:type II secretory pathway pseudopilin PulG
MVPIAVAVLAALALGSGKPARGEVSVFHEQAEATAVATQALDAARSEARATWHATIRGDAAMINSVDWMEPSQPAWFPVTADDESANSGAADEATRAGLLALTPSPMRTAGLTNQAVAPQPEIISYEYAVIPLPPAAWTGLAGLASLATIGGRKALIRFFCN